MPGQLLSYNWPGNIRELKNVVERSVYRHGDSLHPLGEIIIDPFFSDKCESDESGATALSAPTLPLNLRHWQREQEAQLLQKALSLAGNHQHKAADLLGLTYYQLRAMLKKHQAEPGVKLTRSSRDDEISD